MPEEIDRAPEEEYGYCDAGAPHTRSYLWPAVRDALALEFDGRSIERSVFDLDCGNGALMADRADRRSLVCGVAQARQQWPAIPAFVGSEYDNLSTVYGQFSAVISLKVVEHLYAPRKGATSRFSLVVLGGVAILSTPYHGYAKNLALVTGKLDRHFIARWDHGHIKFRSVKRSPALLAEAGFVDICFRFTGRIPALAKGMVAVAPRPLG